MTRRWREHLTSARRAFATLRRQEGGAAAIEFGLLGPTLLLSLVVMADVGLALSERMTLDHILRSGAQPAMADLGASNVNATIAVAAEAQKFPVCSAGSPANGSFCPTVVVSCFCPDGSTATCASPTACPVTFQKVYTISATRTRKSIILPDFNFQLSLKVQTR